MREKLGREWSAGFTLMEVIVSLAVIAVAATIGVSMFGRSYALGEDVRDRRAAQRVAHDILFDLQHEPGAYTWPAVTDSLQPVTRTDENAQPAAPAVAATEERMDRAIKDRYTRMKWHAYVRRVADAKTCELTVVVSWVRAGKARSFTLTTLAPLRVLEGKA
jgi:prepilin-type N-terminal cleavage/methylation domain-containing protein